MKSPWIAVREVIPWVTPAPYFIRPGDGSRRRSELRAASFKIFEANSAGSTSERELVKALGDALPFPEYFGNNWDAFDDSLCDLQDDGFGPLALIVAGVDRQLKSDVHAFARRVPLLQVMVGQVETSGDTGFQFEVFFIGEFRVAPAS